MPQNHFCDPAWDYLSSGIYRSGHVGDGKNGKEKFPWVPGLPARQLEVSNRFLKRSSGRNFGKFTTHRREVR
jgi:hypothetical protein